MRKTFLWLEYTWMKYFRYFSSWNCHFHMPNLSKIKVSAERKETLFFFFQLHLSVHFQFTACMTTRKSWFCNMKFYDFMSLKGLLHISSFLFLFAVNNFPNNSYAFHKRTLTADFYAGHCLCYNLWHRIRKCSS